MPFEDYTPDELFEIIQNLFFENEYLLLEQAKNELHKYIQKSSFDGNGRAMRNLFDKIIEIQANRIVEEESFDYNTIHLCDIQNLSTDKKNSIFI